PMLVRCGSHALFCLPTGDGVSWPAHAEDGWECIPERVYLDSAPSRPQRWWYTLRERLSRSGHGPQRPRNEARPGRSAITLVTRLAGPVHAHADLVGDGESPLGTLRIHTDSGEQALA